MQVLVVSCARPLGVETVLRVAVVGAVRLRRHGPRLLGRRRPLVSEREARRLALRRRHHGEVALRLAPLHRSELGRGHALGVTEAVRDRRLLLGAAEVVVERFRCFLHANAQRSESKYARILFGRLKALDIRN